MLRLMLQNLDLHRFGSCKYHWEAPWIGRFFIHRAGFMMSPIAMTTNCRTVVTAIFRLCGASCLFVSATWSHWGGTFPFLGMVLDGSKREDTMFTNLFWLVVWNMNFIFPYIGKNHSHPNWRTHIFQRGRYTTNLLGVSGIHLPVVVQVIHKHVSTNQTSNLFSSQLL